MSRIGKKPILIPEGVGVKIEGQQIIIKGPKGEISQEIRPEISIEEKEGKIFVSPRNQTPKQTKQIKALWGATGALIANMIKGVFFGFEQRLEIQGIGFRAVVEGQDLVLYVGFSHPVRIKIPDDIKIALEKNIIIVSGFDKRKVAQLAANIKRVKLPEPYKGKGIRHQGEQIRRKVGKRVVGTTG